MQQHISLTTGARLIYLMRLLVSTGLAYNIHQRNFHPDTQRPWRCFFPPLPLFCAVCTTADQEWRRGYRGSARHV